MPRKKKYADCPCCRGEYPGSCVMKDVIHPRILRGEEPWTWKDRIAPLIQSVRYEKTNPKGLT